MRNVLIIDSEDYRIPKRQIEPSQRHIEVQRVRNAFKPAAEQLTKIKTKQGEIEAGEIKDIFAVHLRFLRDRSLRKKITDMIYSDLVTAEYAVSTTLREIAVTFRKGQRPLYQRASGGYL